MDFQDCGQSARCFELLKTIWAGRRVIMVEGRLTRFGVGNDLLESAHSVRRIICPERNAYRQYRRILDAMPQPDASTLVLVALGPTAKPLVHELAGRGYQAIDIGHLDIEYEWFLRKATRKILIPGKYVDEVDPKLGGFSDEDEEVTTDIITPDYPRQVIVRIGED
jgi:glycosyltransferase family protein